MNPKPLLSNGLARDCVCYWSRYLFIVYAFYAACVLIEVLVWLLLVPLRLFFNKAILINPSTSSKYGTENNDLWTVNIVMQFWVYVDISLQAKMRWRLMSQAHSPRCPREPTLRPTWTSSSTSAQAHSQGEKTVQTLQTVWCPVYEGHSFVISTCGERKLHFPERSW